jgi:hypothetical protein
MSFVILTDALDLNYQFAIADVTVGNCDGAKESWFATPDYKLDVLIIILTRYPKMIE